MGRQAVEHEDITRLVVRRQPTPFEPVERPIAHPRGALATRPNRQSSVRAGNGPQGNPRREHVLHALVVLVDDVAWLPRDHRGGIDDPREFERVAKPHRSQELAHQVGERADEGDLVEFGVGQNPPVPGIGERVEHSYGLDGRQGSGRDRVRSGLRPPRLLEMTQRRPADGRHQARIEQLPHEEVAIAGQPGPKPGWISHQILRVPQLGRTSHQSHTRIVHPRGQGSMG
jgi:hypothetical protein